MRSSEFRGTEHTFEAPGYKGALSDSIKAEAKVTLDNDNGTLVQKVGWKNQIFILRKPGDQGSIDITPEKQFERRVKALGLCVGKKCMEQMVGYSPDEAVVVTKYAGREVMHIPADAVASIGKQTWDDLLETLQDVTPKGVVLDTGGIGNMVLSEKSGLTMIDYAYEPESVRSLNLTGELELASTLQLMYEELYYPEGWDKVIQQGIEVLKGVVVPGDDSKLDDRVQHLSQNLSQRMA